MAQVLVDPVAKTCTPDSVTARGRNATTVFKITQDAGKNWKWGDPAIVVQATPGVFSGGSNPGGNGKGNVNVQSRNSQPGDAGSYKYTANLINTATSATVAIDPEIVNALD